MRTLRGEGKLEVVVGDLARAGVDVCGICETRWNEAGEVEAEDVLTGKRYTVWAGAADARGVGGVGVAVAAKWLEAVEGWEAVSSRVGC